MSIYRSQFSPNGKRAKASFWGTKASDEGSPDRIECFVRPDGQIKPNCRLGLSRVGLFVMRAKPKAGAMMLERLGAAARRTSAFHIGH
jgi:hypothetical protein